MRRWTTATAAALAILLSTPALAGPPPSPRLARVSPPAQSSVRAKIKVELVVAREAGPVDPGLEGIARQLRSKGLTSVRRVTAESARLEEDGSVVAKIDGRRMKVTLLELMPDQAKVRYAAHRDGEELFHQVYTAPRGKVGVLAGMGAYRGGKLFGAITVER